MALSSLPLVSGAPGRHGCSSKPASRAKRQARSERTRRPPGNVTSDDVLSVSRSAGTPPGALTTATQQARGSSAARVLE